MILKCHLNILLLLTNLSLMRSANDIDDETMKKMIAVFGKPPADNKITGIFSNPPADMKITDLIGNPTTDKKITETSTEFSLKPPKLEGASNKECTREDGQKGVCVTYYQCDPETKRLITSGETLIDIRKKECDNYFEVCCLPNLVNTTSRESDRPKKEEVIGCGYSNPGGTEFRINDNNGTRAIFGEFPWMVAIMKNTAPEIAWEQKSYIGGGAIIHPKVVLTAAHKIQELEPSNVKCRAGEWDTQTDQEIDPHQERVASKFVIHEEFYRPTALNDVALIILERPFDISSETPHIGVACLAPSLPVSGTMCLSMGWGQENFNNAKNYASILKKVTLPLINRERCERALRGTRLGAHFQLHKTFICAGGVEGTDTCTGDGGSPLVYLISERRYAVVGLVAWGIGCNQPNIPGVYVHVPELKSWIDKKMTEEVKDTSSYNYD